ncbi:(-)-germacrene D synthase-like [Diospyros lotus]|uniref:(-)-germacrene D synthase-like n=1 Tax=Diospyros lotus TaxID=55363 RepID=UPI0022555829|nr:(-)-germacrene D synthase-like [Diospyros lotus]
MCALASDVDMASRHVAKFPPSIWGDRFLECLKNPVVTDTTFPQFIELKEEMRRVLREPNHNPLQKLNLIDAMQRLGVSYHFEKEIKEELKQMYDEWDDKDNDLYIVALLFRLLRQDGYRISCDVFTKFMDEKGSLKISHSDDVHGMLSLYEASFLKVNGEELLDKAMIVASTHLRHWVASQVSPSLLFEQVIHALARPIRKALPRINVRHYISIYKRRDDFSSHNAKLLIKFAKLDFNMLQTLHQREINDIIKWWRALDTETKLPYARDRVVECYFWILGVYFEPQYSLGRRLLTKVTTLVSVIDDTYDAYGTIQELKLFTKAIQRWDTSTLESLPEYMKVLYQAILDVYTEIEEETTKEGKPYCVHYSKEAMKKLCSAYHVEAEWCHNGYVPTIEEYLKVAAVSCAYPLIATISLIGMGEFGTKEAFNWLSEDPLVLTESSLLCRLMDDITSHKFEQEREHVASAVECYVSQHGVSEEEAIDELRKRVSNSWNIINEELLKPTAVTSIALLTRFLNLARVMDLIYQEEDGYTNAHLLRDYVTSLIIEPIIM